jgi:hypothetical protein
LTGRRGRGGRTVLSWVRICIPVPDKKVVRREVERVRRKGVKEAVALTNSSRSVNVFNRESLTLATKSGR